MSDLKDLPNISKVLESKLSDAGIINSAQLYHSGSKEAFNRIYQIDPSACLNMFFALEGAIQGIRWHHLSKEEKARIKSQYEEIIYK